MSRDQEKALIRRVCETIKILDRVIDSLNSQSIRSAEARVLTKESLELRVVLGSEWKDHIMEGFC